jgi:hypothetical protein
MKAMITGWEVMDDEEVEEIRKEVMKETELRIRPYGKTPEKKVHIQELNLEIPSEIPEKQKMEEEKVSTEN